MFIYKIENLINGKIYIGKTNNFNRRKTEHFPKNSKHKNKNKILYNAIEKHGKENFQMSVIEETENWQEREKFWIKKLNCREPFGYNMTEGGENPPLLSGEKAHSSKLTWKKVKEIKILLTGKLSYKKIAEKYNIGIDQIYRINTGENWVEENETYPVRKHRSITEEEAKSIIWYLQNTKLTQKEIGKKFKRSRTAITAINNGQNHYRENLSYPIRKGKHYESEACID